MPKTFLLFYSWLLEFTTEKYSPHLPVQIKKTLSNPWGRNWAEKFKAMDFFFLLSAAASGAASSAKCPSARKEYWRLSIGLIAILFLKTDLLKGVDGMWTSKMAQCLERSITSVPVCARCGFYQLQVIELSTYRNGRTANKPKLSEREMGGGKPKKTLVFKYMSCPIHWHYT